MLGTADETPYDLRFSVAGIPVRISVWFWVMGAVLGFDSLKMGVQYLLAWYLVLFVSILVHELGHALTARYFGHAPSILLYQFGGLAFYQPFRQHTRGKSILITLAGPLAGFLLFGLTWAAIAWGLPAVAALPEQFQRLVLFMLLQSSYVNFFWSLLNLLPVLPLDGGRISQEICTAVSPFRGTLIAAGIGAVVAGGVAAWFFAWQESYNAVLFAMLCASNISIIQQLRGRY